MFKRILVPLDGSSFAERALAHAEAFARIFDASIVLLRVLEPSPQHDKPLPIDPLNWEIRKIEAEQYMSAVAQSIQGRLNKLMVSDTDSKKSQIAVEYVVREGKTAENIVNFAHENNIDLLVICTHGWGGLSRWNISSVTQKVINLIYLPVLMVRAYEQQPLENSQIHYRRILLPFDSSRRAECVLAAGSKLANAKIPILNEVLEAKTPSDQNKNHVEQGKPTLILTTIIKRPELPIQEPHPPETKKVIDQLMQLSKQSVQNYLNKITEQITGNCEIRIMENNSVVTALSKIAEEEKVDLVVLCAHGSTGQFQCPYGSVSRSLLEDGNMPVLVIQDVPRSQVQPTAAEKAAEKSGRR
jgi:nucleotide-binding universal stress UspA family protein